MRARPLAAAAACGGLLVVLYLAAFHVGPLRALDAAISRRLFELTWGTVFEDLSEAVTLLIALPVYAILNLVVLAVAARAGGAGRLLACAGIVLAANVTTQVFKPALAAVRDEPGITAAAWPSGHTTAATATAVALVLALAGDLRRPMARWPLTLAAATALSMGVAVVALGWHYPSDVLAGWLVAAGWGFVALAALRRPGSAPAPTAAPRRAGSQPARG